MSTKEVLSGALKCTKCGEVKPSDGFYKNSRNLRGHEPLCKVCTSEHKEAWRKANQEKYMLQGIKHRAKKTGRECTLVYTDIVIPPVCPILGIPLRRAEGRLDDFSPSLDRLDNDRGYTPDNVRVISWKANNIKSNATSAELRAIADWIDRETEALQK